MKREIRSITAPAEWLAWRRECLTASRIAALFDCHPYLSMDEMVAQLRGGAPEADNRDKRRGRIFEAAVASAIAEEKPDWFLWKPNAFYVLPEHRLGGTPDCFARDASGDTGNGFINVQTKVVNPFEWNRWHGTPPLAYLLQTTCENLVTGASSGVLAVMVTSPDFPLHLYEIPRHEEAEARILDAVAEFWKRWGAGDIAAPAPVGEIAALLDDGSHKDLSKDNEIRYLLSERAEAKDKIRDLEKWVGSIEQGIRTRIGTASTAYVPGWSISYKRQHRKEYTVPAADVRTLRIKQISEEADDAV